MKFRLISIIVAIGIVLYACSALSQDTLDKKEKDPTAASLMSVAVPGSGHVYAGQTWTGIGIFGITFGAPILGVKATNTEDLVFSDQDVNWFPFILGVTIGMGAWIYGIFDADNAARAYNKAHGLMSLRLYLENKFAGISTLHLKMDPMIKQTQFGQSMYGMKFGINF